MSKETIDHSTLICLAEAGAVSRLKVVAQQGGWVIMIRYGEHQRTLIAQRSGKVRVFKRFDAVAAYLKDMGIKQFEVDITDYDPEGSGKGTRPDRSAALKRAHEAAAMDEATYDLWFRERVQESLDDPRPAIPHEEVKAQFAARKAALLKKQGK
ncbi:hypothetical protein [Rahnella contaminans]|uniref:type II toxin-antitoxin system RelB family antitoxin n=1 Tax=Rahnella contaminans TaxID=2703882 RepID=UPI0023DBD643|nr:hypothetical protein [Rahnella contaminans]MDF1896174.1 hypothetical protein [Rahnella contaminans]